MPVSPLIPPLRREIPAELLSELACVTIGSANVEGLLIQFLIFIMAAAHADGMHVICQNASISTVLKWVRLVSEQRFEPEMYEKLKALFNRIQEAMDDRNAYVHGLWRVGPEPGTALCQTLRANRDPPIINELVTFPDLRELVVEIEEIAQELHSIGVECGYFPSD